MDSQFDGTTLIPKDGGTPEDHNKALLDLLGKINEVSKNAASATEVSGNASSAGGDIAKISKGMLYGLEIVYAASDTLTVKIGMAEVNGALAVLASNYSITSSMPNFPGAGAWAYVTIENGGAIRLFSATGAATVRPSDNCYQLAGGGIGYDDLKRFGYYYDSARRIIGAIHKVNATTWYVIKNGPYVTESGQNQNGYWTVDILGGMTARSSGASGTPYSETNAFGSTSGTSYAGDASWTYPVPFVSTPDIAINGQSGTIKETAYNILVNQLTIQLKTKTNATANYNVIAYGRRY